MEDLIQPEEMIEDLTYLVTVLKEAWAYAEWNHERLGLDLDHLREAYLPKLDRPLSLEHFVDTLRLFAAELQEGHVGVSPPSNRAKSDGSVLPWRLYLYGDQVYVRSIADHERWELAPELGDRVVSIQGEPIAAVVERVRARTSASTAQHRRALVAERLPSVEWYPDLESEASVVVEPEQIALLQSDDDPDPASFGIPTSGWSPRQAYKPTFETSIEPFAGMLILLIDSLCFSTTDNFVACVQDQRPDALVLGSGTGGGTGAPVQVTLPRSGVTVSFCTMKVYRPAGGLIEGIGSEPDLAVSPTPADLRAGRDRVLETALDVC